MSDPERRTLLKKTLEEMGNAWLLGTSRGDNLEQILDRVLADLDKFAAEYERRFGEKPDPFRLYGEDPYKAKAFFQIDTLKASVEMKIMIWRLLLGCEIDEITFHYRQEQEMDLSVFLRSPSGEREGPYQGREHFTDFRVLRHFGVGGKKGRLVLQGYYPLK
jgi:hypothetical protein